jgi:hypothetical protein
MSVRTDRLPLNPFDRFTAGLLGSSAQAQDRWDTRDADVLPRLVEAG